MAIKAYPDTADRAAAARKVLERQALDAAQGLFQFVVGTEDWCTQYACLEEICDQLDAQDDEP